MSDGKTLHPDPARQNDRERGLYDKYRVERHDGDSRKHRNCQYIVLDATHDRNAPPAILAYARAVRLDGYEALADDLEQLVAESDPGSRLFGQPMNDEHETPEQAARNMLERIDPRGGVEDLTAGDVAELANLIARDRERRSGEIPATPISRLQMQIDVTGIDAFAQALDEAWALISAAGNGDWSKETTKWREAAERWRDRFGTTPAQFAERQAARAEKARGAVYTAVDEIRSALNRLLEETRR